MKLLTVDYPEQFMFQITLSATAEELEAGAQAVYERARSTFTIKGFEKGAANRAEIEADRGEHAFWYDAINDIMDAEVPAIYAAAIKENNIIAVNEPSYELVSVNKEDGFTATINVCTLPTFEIGDYKGIEVTATPTYVTEASVQHYIERKQRLNAELVPHKGPAVKGNTVHVTYLGLVDDKPFKGGNGENVELVLGTGRMIPGFEDAIIGHCAGDAFDIKVTFPKNYREASLRGKEAIFKTKLIDACVKELPALNADFAKKVGDVDTMEEYREAVKTLLKQMRHNNAVNQAKTRVLSELGNRIVGAVPETMVTAAYTAELQHMQDMLQQQNMTKTQYLQTINKTDAEFTEEMKAKAERGVRVNLGLLQIGLQENLAPSEEELTAVIAERCERMKKTREEFEATVNMTAFVQSLMRKATVDMIVETANMTITEPVKPEPPAKRMAPTPGAN